MCMETNKKIFGPAPLAGFSDLPFRLLCYENGADFAVTEMVSAKALFYNSEKTDELLRVSEDEGRLVLQLFGHEPEIFEKVIKEKINHRRGFSSIDLNMGCPAPKIVKNGDGSALMEEPLLASKVIRSMVKSSNSPVSVKFRLGPDSHRKNFLEIGKIAQEEGAASVCLHARTREAMYSGRAEWEAIAELKNRLSIPVIGNGDVDSPQSAVKMLDQTGCDGIAIGRGAIGKPFLFGQIKSFIDNGTYSETPLENIISTMISHYKMEIDLRGEHRALLVMRKNFTYYLKGLRGIKEAGRIINQTEDMDQVEQVLRNLLKLNS